MSARRREYSESVSPIAFSYPEKWIIVTYPPAQPGGAFFDLHNGISALESTSKEDSGLVAYKPGDFSLRLLVYRRGWQGDPYLTAIVEGQRLQQDHFRISEPTPVDLGTRTAAQVNFTNMRARDGAFIVFSFDNQSWLFASLSAAVNQLPDFLPDAYAILASIRLVT